jgi:hypothetical protein
MSNWPTPLATEKPDFEREVLRMVKCSSDDCYRQAHVRHIQARLLGKDETSQQCVFRTWHACSEHVFYYSRYTGEELYQRERQQPYFHMFFLMTREHLALAKRLHIVWYDVEDGAPGCSIRRPYGNSDVLEDIAEIIGYRAWTHPGCYSDQEEQHLKDLHRAMQIVLQIIVHTGQMKTGVYKKPGLSEDWIFVEHPVEEEELVLASSDEEMPHATLTI